MAIRHGLLALLSQGPRYGYQLRAEFEASTGATWPLNIGQVYTTLSRLERDGLVSPGEQDEQGRVVYTITEAGRAEMERWFATPVAQADRPRDELVIKLAMAVTAEGGRAAGHPGPAHRDHAHAAGAHPRQAQLRRQDRHSGWCSTR